MATTTMTTTTITTNDYDTNTANNKHNVQSLLAKNNDINQNKYECKQLYIKSNLINI